MKNLKISIPTPCHEDWNKMNPNSGGRFCNSCEKTVIDFTKKNHAEIRSVLDNATGEVCGRFKTSDVYNPAVNYVRSSRENTWFRSKWLMVTTILSLIGFSKKAVAQGKPMMVSNDDDTISTKTPFKTTATVIHGWIKNLDEKKGIAQVEIRVYSGGKEVAYTKNFANGSYFITLPENTVFDFVADIEYSSVDYQTQILRELPIQKDRVKCDVNLSQLKPEMNYTTMGGIGGRYEYGTEIENNGIGVEHTVGQVVNIYEEPIIEEMYKLENDSTGNDTRNLEDNAVADKTFDVIAYPNPGIGLFNFKIENSEKSEIFIFDIDGKLVDSRKTTSSNEQVDLTKQPNGTYVVRVVSISQNKVKQLKLIKID